MPLFHVQDSDRPGFVVAENYAEAVRKWQAAVSAENDGEEPGNPQGVSLMCDDGDLIIDQDWVG